MALGKTGKKALRVFEEQRRHGGSDVSHVVPARKARQRLLMLQLEGTGRRSETREHRAQTLNFLRRIGIPTVTKAEIIELGGKMRVLVPDLSAGKTRQLFDAFELSFAQLKERLPKDWRVLLEGISRDLAVLHRHGLCINDRERWFLEPWVFFRKSEKARGFQRAIVDTGAIVKPWFFERAKKRNLLRWTDYFAPFVSADDALFLIEAYFKHSPDERLKRWLEHRIGDSLERAKRIAASPEATWRQVS